MKVTLLPLQEIRQRNVRQSHSRQLLLATESRREQNAAATPYSNINTASESGHMNSIVTFKRPQHPIPSPRDYNGRPQAHTARCIGGSCSDHARPVRQPRRGQQPPRPRCNRRRKPKHCAQWVLIPFPSIPFTCRN